MSRALRLLAPALAWGAYTWGSLALGPARARRGGPGERAVALTFDDGPDGVYTPRVLDILGQEGVPAAFFLIGERAARWPGLVRRLAEAGHDLGNHTWSHRSLWSLGPGQTGREVRQGHAAIADAAGRAPRFFRPPWGMTNLALFPALHRLGTPCVLWSVQTEGRWQASANRQVERLGRRVHPGAIVDLHDANGVPGAGERLVAALPSMIRLLREAGYRLVPLRDLLL